jgi:hypothetical protein
MPAWESAGSPRLRYSSKIAAERAKGGGFFILVTPFTGKSYNISVYLRRQNKAEK